MVRWTSCLTALSHSPGGPIFPERASLTVLGTLGEGVDRVGVIGGGVEVGGGDSGADTWRGRWARTLVGRLHQQRLRV